MPLRRWSIPALACLAAAGVLVFLLLGRPAREPWGLKKVHIPKGSNYPEIERILREAEVLRHPAAFRALVTVTLTGRKLQHGEYAFPAPPSALELWRKITAGDVAKYQVTVPDGSTLFDISRTLGELELADPDAFFAAATSRALVNRLGIPNDTAEGFLFPDTYLLVKDMKEEEILRIMFRRLTQKFPPDPEGSDPADGFTLREIVTIASIIEKETGVEAEKPLVSSVIRRRLALGMPLQMDPTVIYGLKKFGQPLTRKDLLTPNPYNTYLNRGLPPGPIANPGLSSLMAAIRPAETKYLYFVSRNDGTHRFSETLAEHNRAVAEYRRGNAKKAAGVPPAGEEENREGATPRPPQQGPS
jgi:UPF0755 protein